MGGVKLPRLPNFCSDFYKSDPCLIGFKDKGPEVGSFLGEMSAPVKLELSGDGTADKRKDFKKYVSNISNYYPDKGTCDSSGDGGTGIDPTKHTSNFCGTFGIDTYAGGGPE